MREFMSNNVNSLFLTHLLKFKVCNEKEMEKPIKFRAYLHGLLIGKKYSLIIIADEFRIDNLLLVKRKVEPSLQYHIMQEF